VWHYINYIATRKPKDTNMELKSEVKTPLEIEAQEIALIVITEGQRPAFERMQKFIAEKSLTVGEASALKYTVVCMVSGKSWKRTA